MDFLSVSAVSKHIEGNIVVNEVSFVQQQFRKLAIAGETGSGKSTLLKIMGGLVQPDSGAVLFENVKVKGPEEKLIPGHAAIAYLSQQFELRNNYRVEEVLQYANQLTEEDAHKIYEVCRIDHLLQRKTDQVSGGEKQRIAVARLLISSPRLLLLDEPYSNLDMIHKNILRSVIYDIGKRLNITCILVSHDPNDTLSWADEIIVMKNGKLVQKGPPEHIYRYPETEYVAGLFGTYNLLSPGAVEAYKFFTPERNEKYLFVRPENLHVSKESGSAEGIVSKVNFLGSCYALAVRLSEDIITVLTDESNFEIGDPVYVSLKDGNAWFI